MATLDQYVFHRESLVTQITARGDCNSSTENYKLAYSWRRNPTVKLPPTTKFITRWQYMTKLHWIVWKEGFYFLVEVSGIRKIKPAYWTVVYCASQPAFCFQNTRKHERLKMHHRKRIIWNSTKSDPFGFSRKINDVNDINIVNVTWCYCGLW